MQLWNWAVFSAMVKVGLIPEETRLEQDMPPNCSTTLSWEGGGGLGRAWGWGWWFGWVKGCFTMCKKINVFNVHVREERSCSFHNPGFRHSCASIVRAAEANFNSSGIQTDWPKFLVQTRFCGEWNLEFGSNTTDKFEISWGEAEWDLKFFCGVWKPNSKFNSHQKRVCD